MQLIADLHLHSKYSRAVSPQMIIPEMAKWAKIKGIDLLGTGDFTHPLWLSELKANLEEQEQGVFGVKSQVDNANFGLEKDVKFLLTTEISSIYTQGGKTRKIHNLVGVPSFAAAEKINAALRLRGCNLSSDGRPIIGLSAKNLLELVLEVEPKSLFIPCHIWTPHFSLFGSESGFDSLEECFGEMAKYILAVETGLSSDPEMNWQVADLDNRSIVSFSDAHSPSKLGREATVLQVPSASFSYEEVREALTGKREFKSDEAIGEVGGDLDISSGNLCSQRQSFVSYTIEFYPEEGKYHYTGHRNCGVVYSPKETLQKGTTCPVCGRRLTVGVMERVKKLGRQDWNLGGKVFDERGVCWIKQKGRVPFVRMVPLGEIVAESLGVGEETAKVEDVLLRMRQELGSELTILLQKNLEEIAKVGGEKLAEGVEKVRKGEIFVQPGFDGQYGVVKVWGEATETKKNEQIGLF